MKRIFFLSLLLMLFYSCGDKTLQLPQVAADGISEIQNHSQIWVFYDEDAQKLKADVNKNNTIISTNWIVNIDKRLPLSEVIPVFQMIKAKRAKKTVHTVEGMMDYLSYSDTKDEKIALFRIDTLQYIMLPKEEIRKLEKKKKCDYIIEFSKNYFSINGTKLSVTAWNQAAFANMKNSCIQLQFDGSLSYQDYMNYRLQLNIFLPKSNNIEHTEYIIKDN